MFLLIFKNEDTCHFVGFLVLEVVKDSVLEKYWQRIDSFSSLPVSCKDLSFCHLKVEVPQGMIPEPTVLELQCASTNMKSSLSHVHKDNIKVTVMSSKKDIIQSVCFFEHHCRGKFSESNAHIHV